VAKDRPWLMFYPRDWFGDPHLRCCRAASRGVLIDLMCLAHDGTPYGYLINGGKPLTSKEIERALGVPWQTWRACRTELLRKRRLKYDGRRHAYYVPRMVRDGESRERAIADGSRGGNPKLKKAKQSADVLVAEYAAEIEKLEAELAGATDNSKRKELQDRRERLYKRLADRTTPAAAAELREAINERKEKG